MLVTTEAVVLHLQDYLESSRIVRLVTRSHGVQSVVARGARRSRNQFGHSLDLFASGSVRFTVRPGRDLSNLSGFDPVSSRMGIAASLDRFSAASALAELVLKFTPAGQYDETFDVLTAALDALAEADHGTASEIGLSSGWRYVAMLGLAPTMEQCCSCETVVPPGDDAPFSHSAGGVTCRMCERKVSTARILPARARHSIAGWVRGEGGSGGEAATTTGDADRRAHLRLFGEYVRYHLSEGGALPALDAWEAQLRRPA